VGEAGAGGEAGEPAGGHGGSLGSGGATPAGGEAGAQSEAGQGGASVGAAGAAVGGAPDTSVAGAAGEPSTAGAGGEGPLACEPSGTTYGININPENQQTVCRGAQVVAAISASDSDPSFTCCGVSDTTVPYNVDLIGITGSENDIVLTVPDNAPLGAQSITATCTSSVTNTIDIIVSATPAPVVTGLASSSLYASDTVVINGSNFNPALDRVMAVPASGSNSASECAIAVSASSSTSISCNFDSINHGDYDLILQQSNCGFALTVPRLTILPVP
jgi:hypothetical protein